MKKFRYKNLFIYSSFQFAGNTEEYFKENTEKLVTYIVMPRLKNKHNVVRLYRKGRLINEKKVASSEKIFIYYVLWYWNYIKSIYAYFSSKEKVIVISGHPISFFCMSLQKLFRKITYVYFVGDYFPPVSFVLYLYEKLKKFYHDRIPYTYYLSDGINKQMNGKVLNTEKRKTIMWGVNAKKIMRSSPHKSFSILFVGVVKESQGLDYLLKFLISNKNYVLNIIGICDKALYKKYNTFIVKNNLQDRVFFPNRFYSDDELNELSKKCHVGIALYNADKSNPTYYTDPGKVKAYAEMGLPVIMTDTSGIASYIKKFKAGIVIERKKESLENALVELRRNYTIYINGLKKFNEFFYFKTYYKRSFEFLEKI